MEMPTQIPRYALETSPRYEDLFMTKYTQHSHTSRKSNNNQTSTTTFTASKVTAAIHEAKDINKCYEDLDVQPPLMILDETIYDHRSQYPLPNSQKSAMSILFSQPVVVPAAAVMKETTSTTTAAKRRAANSNENIEDKGITPVPPKRLCNDGDIKPTRSTTTTTLDTSNTSSPSSGLANRLENTQITRSKPVIPPTKQTTTAVGATTDVLSSSQSKSKFDSQGFGKFRLIYILHVLNFFFSYKKPYQQHYPTDVQ